MQEYFKVYQETESTWLLKHIQLRMWVPKTRRLCFLSWRIFMVPTLFSKIQELSENTSVNSERECEMEVFILDLEWKEWELWARISRRISTGYPYKKDVYIDFPEPLVKRIEKLKTTFFEYPRGILLLIGRVITVLWSLSQILRPLSKFIE